MLVVVKKYKSYTIKTGLYKSIIKLKKLSMDLKKVKVIVNCRELSNVTELRSFLGFCNYY